MFGNILIDKLQINIREDDLAELGHDAKSFKENVREVLLKHYHKTAFKVYSKRKEVKINLTPTRYIHPESPNIDNNLEMPSESWFYNLFKELGITNDRRLNETFRIVELHLTKNIITEYNTDRYIDYLKNRKYHRMKANIINSSSNCKTLSLATSRFKKDGKNTVGDRQFIFYEKIKQIKDKRYGYYVQLREPIAPDVLAALPHREIMSKNGGELYLNAGSYILRTELQYKYTGKLKKLAQFIKNNKSEKTLRLSLFTELMKNSSLYNTLEAFYTSELKEFVFYIPPQNTQTKSLSFWKNTLIELFNKIDNADIKLIAGMYADCGLEDKFQACLRDMQPGMYNKLYKELYEKFKIDRQK